MKFATVMISVAVLSTIWLNIVEMRAVENMAANSLKDRCVNPATCTQNSDCCSNQCVTFLNKCGGNYGSFDKPDFL